MTTRNEIEGFGSIKQLAAIGPQALAEAEKLLEDNELLTLKLAREVLAVQELQQSLDSAITRISEQQRTITTLQGIVSQQTDTITTFKPDAMRYCWLRSCDPKRIPRTSTGEILGGDKLDSAIDEALK
jgi:hypothetical protein